MRCGGSSKSDDPRLCLIRRLRALQLLGAQPQPVGQIEPGPSIPLVGFPDTDVGVAIQKLPLLVRMVVRKRRR